MPSQAPRIYNLFPTLVGPVARWSEHLDRIAAMRFDWIYLNPFMRTGGSRSLYAVADPFVLNPELQGDDPRPGDELLREFVARARERGIDVMLDLVVNHTAKDAPLVSEHPEWYRHEEGGSVASPGAVDPDDPQKVTVWGDLAELNYDERPERAALVGWVNAIVRHYLRLGFRGFRCDAAYKIPGDVWGEVIAAARAERSDAFFAAETLGCTVEQVLQLGSAGFDDLFNSSKWWDFRAPWLLEQYEAFRHIAPSIAFPESHDTPRLIEELPQGVDIEAEYRFRYLFAAFFSSGVMMPVGYEYGFSKRLDVVNTSPADWETPRFDISAFIAEVNAMKAGVAVLNEEGAERLVTSGSEAVVGLLRQGTVAPGVAVALFNPDPAQPAEIEREVLGVDGDLREITPAANDAPLAERIVVPPLSARVFTSAPHGNGAVHERAASNGSASSSDNGNAPGSNGSTRTATGKRSTASVASEARPVAIEAVWPQIDGGRFAIKRTVGERLTVEADIFREGHDAIAAVLKFRDAGGAAWREVPMRPLENDRWSASFSLERVGRYEYQIEAWPDAFASWQHDVTKKRAAGQAIEREVDEGMRLVHAARERANPAARTRLDGLLADMANAEPGATADILLSPGTLDLVARAPDRSRASRSERTFEVVVDRRAARFSTWYEFFPRSQSNVPGAHGTFADAARRLPDIRAMGFDVVYLPPIHPIGHAHRKGRNNALEAAPEDPGSPWAIGNEHGGHMAVEPALGTLEDFERFVASARSAGIEVALDYALQCSPDHPYVREHPEWFSFRSDGTLRYAENPPKKYEDIVNFNWYGPAADALWNELRDVVEFWIARGVTIFRVDNPHTKPFDFWEWMIADVRSRHPEVLFLAEAFTRPKVMLRLAKLGFTQSYTYFTWRNYKRELIEYLSELAHGEAAQYFRPNFFANTPDILPPYLQTGGRAAFRIRLVLAATLSSVYGIYSGFELCENAALEGREEYADSEKYEVKPRDWDAPGNIKGDISKINRIRRENVALQDWRNIRFLPADDENVLFFAKTAENNTLLVAVNLDPFEAHECALSVPLAELGLGDEPAFECTELLGGSRRLWHGGEQRVRLDPQENPAAIYRIERRLARSDPYAS